MSIHWSSERQCGHVPALGMTDNSPFSASRNLVARQVIWKIAWQFLCGHTKTVVTSVSMSLAHMPHLFTCPSARIRRLFSTWSFSVEYPTTLPSIPPLEPACGFEISFLWAFWSSSCWFLASMADGRSSDTFMLAGISPWTLSLQRNQRSYASRQKKRTCKGHEAKLFARRSRCKQAILFE